MSSSNAIEVKNLTKKYGEFIAVNNISFEVKKGEVFSLLGPNGAGKTTTTEILECLKNPSSGVIKVLGVDIKNERNQEKIKKLIGVMPQEFNTFDNLTVKENIDYFRILFDSEIKVEELINLVGLNDKTNERYRNLSGGLKQKVGISISLVNEPELIFLDEPTAGLDPMARQDVWNVIKDLKEKGKTIFMTTHYLEEAQALSDTITIMDNGKIVAQDSPRKLIKSHGGMNTLAIKNNKEVSRLLNMKLNEIKKDKEYILIPYNKFSEISQIIIKLNDNDLGDELEIRKPNLESVFLNLTGKTISSEGNTR